MEGHVIQASLVVSSCLLLSHFLLCSLGRARLSQILSYWASLGEYFPSSGNAHQQVQDDISRFDVR